MPENPSHIRIKKLSPLLINQLAAGEVVTRPAAVVKELLENAIDAGATYIEVRITQGGMGMIEVVDNGVGIHPDDMVMALTRHATSKVADIANLHGISTLGFRGEALAATAAVSRLSLASSHNDSGIGRQLQVAGVLADMPKMMPVVRNRGTSVTVKDLYFNVPARRGNLKSIATEFTHIETVVCEVAVAHADVSLALFHDNKKRLSLSHDALVTTAESSTSTEYDYNRLPLPRLEQALGMALTDNAIKVVVDLTSLIQSSAETDNGQPHSHIAYISGWIWPTYDQQTSQSTSPKLLYVNGRLVKEPLISNQLRQLARSAQLDGISYALYFDLPSNWLNVNVHPSKQRIKISPLNNIMAHLGHTIGLKLKSVTADKNTANTNTVLPIITGIEAVNYSYDSASLNATGKDRAITGSNANAINNYKNALINESPLTKQVQEKAQLYQYTVANEPAVHAVATRFDSQATDFISNHKSTTANEVPATELLAVDMRAIDLTTMMAASSIALPHCLEFIGSLDYRITVETKNSLSDSCVLDTLPWLLFYNQDKLVLISEQVWKISISSLFEASLPPSAKSSTAVDKINQQLVFYASTMSKQDLIAFTMDIERILMINAIKVIDREQLIDFVLVGSAI